MRNWQRAIRRELKTLGGVLWRGAARSRRSKNPDHPYLVAGLLVAVLALAGGIVLAARTTTSSVRARILEELEHPEFVDYSTPMREEPARFRSNTYLPPRREKHVIGPFSPDLFMPKYDLVRVEDDRVWWESEHDTDDIEDDHLVHRALEDPLRRVIELVSRHGGRLKVHDAYRPSGVHASNSFHRVGRAVDLTCDELGLEKLAKLCWAAGFDWVYHETPKRGGAHVHASVKE